MLATIMVLVVVSTCIECARVTSDLFDDEDSLSLISSDKPDTIQVDDLQIIADEQTTIRAKVPAASTSITPTKTLLVSGDVNVTNAIDIDTDYSIFIWPKGEAKNNISTVGIDLEFEVQPHELMEFEQVNVGDTTHWHLRYRLNGPSPKIAFAIQSRQTLPVAGSPFVLPVSDKVFARASFLAAGGDGLLLANTTQVWRAGNSSVLDLHVLNSHGKTPESWSGLQIEPMEEFVDVRHHYQNGTLHLVFTSSKSGNYTYNIKIHGQHVIGSPFNVTILPGMSTTRQACSAMSRHHQVALPATDTLQQRQPAWSTRSWQRVATVAGEVISAGSNPLQSYCWIALATRFCVVGWSTSLSMCSHRPKRLRASSIMWCMPVTRPIPNDSVHTSSSTHRTRTLHEC
jgi:hypothetical protein